jgi:hypothetical protein
VDPDDETAEIHENGCLSEKILVHSSLILALDGSEWSASWLHCSNLRERASCTHLIEGWVVATRNFDAVERRKSVALRTELQFLGCPAHNLVTLLTEISQPPKIL